MGAEPEDPFPLEVGCSIFTPNIVWGQGRMHGSRDGDRDA